MTFLVSPSLRANPLTRPTQHQVDSALQSSVNFISFTCSVGFSKPSITQFRKSVVVDEPSKLKETCKASGFPVPKITWQQNGKQMPLCLIDESNSCIGQNYQVMELSRDEHAFSQSTLIIVQTEYPRDHGKYTCLASNREGSVKMTMNVSIHSKYNSQLIVNGMLHIL